MRTKPIEHMKSHLTRPLDELLEIMIEHIDSIGSDGLCLLLLNLNVRCIISNDEYLTLDKYILRNRPKNLRYYFHSSFFWKPGKKRPRLRWLRKHIKRLRKYEYQ